MKGRMTIHAEKDHQTGIIDMYLGGDRQVRETIEYPGVIVDRDEKGRPISLEILTLEENGLEQAILAEGLAEQKMEILRAVSAVQ